MMILDRIKLGASLLLVVWIAGCGIFDTTRDPTEKWSAKQLYTAAADALKEGDYQQAIKYYEFIEARYPFGPYALQAELDVAYTYYKSEEYDSAIDAIDRFIKLHPQEEHVDYAYYLRGLVNYNRKLGFIDRYLPTDVSQRDPGSAKDAFQDFSELVSRFPNSRYAEDARNRMLYLRDNLAKSEVHAARYYLHRKAYIAAINRAKYVIENYARTTAVKEALEIMIAAYGELGLSDLQKDTQRVLAMNEAKGTFVSSVPEPGEVSWSRRAWDVLGLDKN